MKKQSTTKGFAILSAAGMIVKVLSLLYIPFLLNIIGEEGYGVYASAYQVYTFVFVLTNAGIPVAISKLISEYSAVGNYKDVIKGFKIARFMLLFIGIIMSMFMIIFAKELTELVHYKKAYLSVLALTPSILFTSIASAYRGYFQGRGNMTPTAVSQVLEQSINTIFTLAFSAILIKYGIEAGCAGGTIGTSLGAFFSAIYLMAFYEKHKRIKVPVGYNETEFKRDSSSQIIRKIIHYGVPITICVGMTYAGSLVDLGNTKIRLMAGGISDASASAMFGGLTRYQQLMNVPIAIIASLAVAILPAISGAAAVNNKEQIKHKINYAFRLCFLIAVPAAVGLAVLSGPIFYLLKFRSGANLMAYGSIVLVFMSIVQIQTTILQSVGKLYVATFYSVIGIAFKVIANYFLIAIPQINILGAVYGTIIGYLVPILLNHRILKKSLKIRFSLIKHAIKPGISAAFMGICAFASYIVVSHILNFMESLYISNAIATIISIIFGIFIYMLGLTITGGLRKSDLEVLPRKLLRLMPKFMIERVR